MTQGTTRDDADQVRWPGDADEPETIDLRALERLPQAHVSRPPVPGPSRNVAALLAAARRARSAPAPPAQLDGPAAEVTSSAPQQPSGGGRSMPESPGAHSAAEDIPPNSAVERPTAPADPPAAPPAPEEVPRPERAVLEIEPVPRALAKKIGMPSGGSRRPWGAARRARPAGHAREGRRASDHRARRAEVLRSVLALAMIAVVFGVLGFLLGGVLQISGR